MEFFIAVVDGVGLFCIALLLHEHYGLVSSVMLLLLWTFFGQCV